MTTQQAATQPGSSIDSRLGCSTILAEVDGQGFGEIDLGALPGVCDHVPTPLPPELVDVLAERILASGFAVRLINADIADMDDAVLGDSNRRFGRGEVDFPAAIEALAASGYRGHYSLELKTHDIEDADRPTEPAAPTAIYHVTAAGTLRCHRR